MPQIRFDLTDPEFAQLNALAAARGESAAQTARSIVLEAAGMPRPTATIVNDVLAEIATLNPGTSFTTGEIIRRVEKANLTYDAAKGSKKSIPSTVSATIGKTLARADIQQAHGFRVGRVVSRTNEFVKL